MTEYVCGYAFNSDRSQVALVLKNRPDFLKGWFNPVGGHLEDTDTDVMSGMAREFKEETGCDTTPDEWTWYGTKRIGSTVSVNFLFAILDDERFASITTVEDEEIHKMKVEHALMHEPKLPHDAKVYLMDAAFRSRWTDEFLSWQT